MSAGSAEARDTASGAAAPGTGAGPLSPGPPQDVVIGPLPWAVGLAGLVCGMGVVAIRAVLRPWWSPDIAAYGGRLPSPPAAWIGSTFLRATLFGAVVALALAATDRLAPRTKRLFTWPVAGAVAALLFHGVSISLAAASGRAAALPPIAGARVLAEAADAAFVLFCLGLCCAYFLAWSWGRRRPMLSFAAGCTFAFAASKLAQAVCWQGTPLAPGWASVLSPWRGGSPAILLQLVLIGAVSAIYGACVGFVAGRRFAGLPPEANVTPPGAGLAPPVGGDQGAPPLPAAPLDEPAPPGFQVEWAAAQRLHRVAKWTIPILTAVWGGTVALQYFLGSPAAPGPLRAAGIQGLWSPARLSAVMAGPGHWLALCLVVTLWLNLGVRWLLMRRLRRKLRQRDE